MTRTTTEWTNEWVWKIITDFYRRLIFAFASTRSRSAPRVVKGFHKKELMCGLETGDLLDLVHELWRPHNSYTLIQKSILIGCCQPRGKLCPIRVSKFQKLGCNYHNASRQIQTYHVICFDKTDSTVDTQLGNFWWAYFENYGPLCPRHIQIRCPMA